MNKKATIFSIENGADALITLLAFIFLVVALGIIIASVINKDNKDAKALADEIIGKADVLDNGEKNDFSIRWLEGWGVFAYNPGEEILPDKCFFESCFCVCPLIGAEDVNPLIGNPHVANLLISDSARNEQKDLCQERGYCRLLETEAYIALGRIMTYKESICIESETGLPFVNLLNKNFGAIGIYQDQDKLEPLIDIRFSKDDEGNIVLSKVYEREDVFESQIENLKNKLILDEEKEICIYKG